MAIDKNSKAYQNLLNKWYSDQQITDMYNQASSWQSRQEVVANTQPVNTPTTPSSTPTTPVEQPTQTTPSTPTTPEVTQGTEIKQAETVGSTVPEIKQEWELKPLSQDYYNQTWSDAQEQIVRNLNNYKQTNPEFFKDYESFKRNFSYNARNEEQRNTLDTWYGGYQKWMELAWIPTTDLYTQYKDGQVSMNELENLRVYDPTKYAELQNQINKWNIIAAYDDDKGQDGTGLSLQDMAYNMATKMFNEFMTWDSSSWASQYFRDYESKMESPEMLALSDQCTEVQEQMENIQSDLDSIKKQVEAEYAGTWATRSKINAIIADRSYDLQLQLRTLNSEYNKYATQYNNRMQQYQNEFSMQLQEYQLNQQARNQQMNELWFAMDLMNFETNDQKAQREWDFWVKQQEYTNWNINSKDYSTRYKAALKSVENLLAQYPNIPMQRSAEQMAQDILNAIDNWSDLWAELTKINKMIQQKPEYKYLYNQTYNPDSPTQKASGLGKTFSLNGIDYVEYNDKIYTAEQFNSMFWWSTWGVATTNGGIEYTTKNPLELMGAMVDWKNANKDWTHGGQCGKFVNDYLQSMGLDRLYGNSVASKTKTINTAKNDLSNLSVWSIAIFDYSNTPWVSDNAKKYGHVWIVVEVDEAGNRVKLKESNLKWDEKVSTRWVTVNWNTLQGFFDPSKWSMGSNSTSWDSNGSFVSWSIEGVPLAYERAVKNLVPAALQNSDKEREALDKIITNSYKWGIDQSEIALTYMGFDIKDSANKQLAMDLVNTVRTLSTDTQEGIVQTISDLMNQGNYTKAIQTVENAVSLQAKNAWNYVSELSVKNTISKSNDLKNTISSLKDSPVWVVEWTMESWLGKYASKNAKNIQSKISLLEQSLDIKDKETAQRILPQLTDTPATFMTKLENLSNNAMLELNGWRNIYGLPSLTTDALNNYSNRVDLYKNGQATTSNNNIQDTNFYQKYANTASWPWSTITLSNWQKVTW